MARFGRESGAIGFAVYLDLLERYEEEDRLYDVDVLLIYDEKSDAQTLAEAMKTLTAQYDTVRAQQKDPDGVKYRRLVTIKNGKLEDVKTDD